METLTAALKLPTFAREYENVGAERARDGGGLPALSAQAVRTGAH